MSLTPYWFRHLRSLGYRDPFAVFSRDPFFRDPWKLMREAVAHDNHGIEGAFSDEVKADGKKVEVHLDVQNFTPEQIQVKTVGHEIMVEGRKEVKHGDGWTRSHFERRFLLPEGFPPERVECHLDKGKLTVIAFRSEPVSERSVPIQGKADEKSDSEKSDPEKS